MNLDGARAGMDAYAHAVGLGRKICSALASVSGSSSLPPSSVCPSLLGSSTLPRHFLRVQKRREDGYSWTSPRRRCCRDKEMAEADDDRPRSSLSRRGGYRFLGTGRKRLFGASDNTFHLRMLHGNILRAITLFHLPITIFTPPTRWPTPTSSLPLPSVSPVLTFAILSVLAPAYTVFCISRAPTAKLYDRLARFRPSVPVYNNYSPGSQLFIVDFARTFVLGVVIGAGQGNGSAQAIIILVFEIMFVLACSLWLPWGEGAMMGPVSFVATCSASLQRC